MIGFDVRFVQAPIFWYLVVEWDVPIELVILAYVPQNQVFYDCRALQSLISSATDTFLLLES